MNNKYTKQTNKEEESSINLKTINQQIEKLAEEGRSPFEIAFDLHLKMLDVFNVGEYALAFHEGFKKRMRKVDKHLN